MDKIDFSFANTSDEEEIRKLLSDSDLPFEDITVHLKNFIMAKKDGELIGVIGLEIYGISALLRSLAVKRKFQGMAVAHQLYTKILTHAQMCGVTNLYLLTKTAVGFFTKLGFIEIQRKDVPKEIYETEQFKCLKCMTAICLTKQIN
ncbi:MAG: GNAT family N-acetyltransferase [Nitrospirae bacterium]|nr:GNAT family N-acetyltransferase [Nitrospirota bacterium]